MTAGRTASSIGTCEQARLSDTGTPPAAKRPLCTAEADIRWTEQVSKDPCPCVGNDRDNFAD